MFPKFPWLGDRGEEAYPTCSAGGGREEVGGTGGKEAAGADGEKVDGVEGVAVVIGSVVEGRGRSGTELLQPGASIEIRKRESTFSTEPFSS